MAKAGSKSGEFIRAVASAFAMDMFCTLVTELRLERFPTIIVGTPRRYDWRYHFGQFLFGIVSGSGEERGEGDNSHRTYDVGLFGFLILCNFRELGFHLWRM